MSVIVGLHANRLNLYVNGVFVGNFMGRSAKDGINRYIRVCLSEKAYVVREDPANVFINDDGVTFD